MRQLYESILACFNLFDTSRRVRSSAVAFQIRKTSKIFNKMFVLLHTVIL
jgi:hypothetical protein